MHGAKGFNGHQHNLLHTMPASFRDQTSHLIHTHTHTLPGLQSKARIKLIPHFLSSLYSHKHMRERVQH